MTATTLNPTVLRPVLTSACITAELATTLFTMADAVLPWVTKAALRQPLLAGRTLATAFYEHSTRTRLSFALAAEYLGMHVVDLNVATSSVQKGEALQDTLATLAAMGVDAMALRHGEAGIHTQVAQPALENHSVLLLNAGAGKAEHPTQALLDAFTLWRRFDGKLAGKTVCMVGDIAHSRVARSNAVLLNTLGVTVNGVAPHAWQPPATDPAFAQAVMTESLGEGLANADAAMALRIQHERHETDTAIEVAQYQLSHAALEQYAPQCRAVLHPGPMNRTVEITNALADDPALSCITQQVTHGVAMRMALLLHGFGVGVARYAS